MSNWVEGDVAIQDIECFAQAIKELGLILTAKGQPRYFSGTGVLCDYIIKVPGRYDLGLKLNAKGEYILVGDSEALNTSTDRGKDLKRYFGNKLCKLYQQYHKEVIKKQAKKMKSHVKFVDCEDGSIDCLWS